MLIKYFKHLIVLGLIIQILACTHTYTPKERAYFRIQYPEHSYVKFDSIYPFRFEIPKYCRVEADQGNNIHNNWANVYFIPFDAKLHLTYEPILGDKDLYTLVEDTRDLVYQHAAKASAIQESLLQTDHKNSGLYYVIKGNTASALQFYLSDSTHNFIRGSLYFNAKMNRDSLQPVIDFVEDDIQHIINTLEWK